MAGTEQGGTSPRRAVAALLLTVAVLASGAAAYFVDDAASDVRGQRASDAGELVTEQKYLSRSDRYHDASGTEFRLTEADALVPGQVEVGDVPRSTRLPGSGEVSASYHDGDLVAVRLGDGTTLTSALFGYRGAVASSLLAGGLLVVAAYAVLAARRPPPPRSRPALAVLLAATGVAWIAVVSALPVVASVLLIEGVGLLVALRLLRSRPGPAPS